MSNDILDELNATFVSKEVEFRGQPLASYTEGSRLLLLQVRDENDSPIWFIWAFLYLHILIKKNRKDAISLCWNKDKFREALLDWVADMSEVERENATEIVSKMIQDSAKTRVEVIPQSKTEGDLGNG